MASARRRAAETYSVAPDRNGNAPSIEIFAIVVYQAAFYLRSDAKNVIPWLRSTNTAKVIINGSKCDLYFLNAPPNNGVHPTALSVPLINLVPCAVACVLSSGGG